MTIINLDDYREDPVVRAIRDLTVSIACWEPEVREEALIVLGDLAIAASTGSKVFHLPIAESLSRFRELIRVVGAQADATVAAAEKEGA